MTNRDAFELWYKRVYWDFSYGIRAGEKPLVSYNEEKGGYNQHDVNLAWNAWNAALDVYNIST